MPKQLTVFGFLLIHEAQQGCRDATYEPSRFPVAVPYPSPHRATPAYVVVTSSDLDTSRNKVSVSGLSWISRFGFAFRRFAVPGRVGARVFGLNIGCRYSTPVCKRPLHPTRSQFKPEASQTQAPVTPRDRAGATRRWKLNNILGRSFRASRMPCSIPTKVGLFARQRRCSEPMLSRRQESREALGGVRSRVSRSGPGPRPTDPEHPMRTSETLLLDFIRQSPAARRTR